MRRNGLERKENYNNSDATIEEFRRDTSYHPQYLTRPAPVVEPVKEVVEPDDYVIAPPAITVTKDEEDSDASS